MQETVVFRLLSYSVTCLVFSLNGYCCAVAYET